MVIKRHYLSILAATALILALFAITSTAFGATTQFGGTTSDSGHLVLTSNTGDTGTANDYSGVSFDVPTGTTFSSLSTLSADYNATDDGCLAGSPRFQIAVDTGSGIKNIFAYMGPQPNYGDCALNTWTNSGDLLMSGRAIDTSQLAGGTFYDTYEHALAAYGAYPVVSVDLVVDSGWAAADGEQTVLIDNVNINGTTTDFTPVPQPTNENDCKKGGWQTYTNPAFKNQGQCVSYMQHQKHADR